MTGKIEDILFSSEAARSLLMEKRVADELRKRHWKANTGIYYPTPDTNKLREMDVYGVQVFDKPRKLKGTGAPLINLYLNCECKSLSGTNVLFLPDEAPFGLVGAPFWLGWELQTVVNNIADQAKITDHGKIKRLYDYMTARAFANGDRAVILDVSMEPPPVDAIAWSFRETRGGKSDDDSVSDRNQSTPVWSAVRAALDGAQAARQKAKATTLEWVYGFDLKFYGTANFARSAAYFFDCELFRKIFFHSVIILDSKLWRVSSGGVEEINSARLYVSDIHHANNYVDIVNSNYIGRYIDSMVSHYERSARRSISKQWDLINKIAWEPGQTRKNLAAILRSETSRRNVVAKSSTR